MRKRQHKGRRVTALPPINTLQSNEQSSVRSISREKKFKEKRPNSIRQLSASFQGALHKISVKVKKEVTLPEPSESMSRLTEALGLTKKHILKLYRNFNRIDRDQSGSIERGDLFSALDEDDTLLTQTLFKMAHVQKGSLTFHDFVVVCSTWCLFSKTDILRFCFDCFDADSSGYIDENEFKVLCITVNHGAPMFPGNFDAALEMLDDNGDGVIDFHEFKTLDKRFPLMLFPVFRMQEKMQRITLGEREWVHIYQKIEEGRSKRLYENTHGGAEPSHPKRRLILPGLSKVQTRCLDPEKVDAMKQGTLLNV